MCHAHVCMTSTTRMIRMSAQLKQPPRNDLLLRRRLPTAAETSPETRNGSNATEPVSPLCTHHSVSTALRPRHASCRSCSLKPMRMAIFKSTFQVRATRVLHAIALHCGMARKFFRLRLTSGRTRYASYRAMYVPRHHNTLRFAAGSRGTCRVPGCVGQGEGVRWVLALDVFRPRR